MRKLKEKAIANKLMKKIEQAILKLEQTPYLYVKIHIKPHNQVCRKLHVNNYAILYDIDEKCKQVVIYRVIYGKRDYLY